MKLLLFFLLFVSHAVVLAQNNVELNSPYYWLKDARKKAAQKDTIGVFSSLEKAVNAGLFDLQALAYNKSLTNMLSRDQNEEITKKILTNRLKIEKPSSIKIFTSDIDNFWDIFPSINDSIAESIFLNQYILKGSTGLQTFYEIRMNNDLNSFIDKIRRLESFYSSIKEVTIQFEDLETQFVDAAEKLEALYPLSIFPPIYFFIGSLNNVGTADGYAGLLIGTEHLCFNKNTDISQLTDFDKMVLFDSSLAVPLIVHEYVHFQQKNKSEETLLDYTIMEGAADFITYLITGRYMNPDVYEYGFSNEKAIWEHFLSEMNEENTDNWLFNAFNPETGYPGNLGYFVGFRICQSYYQKSVNKENAIREILEISDFMHFLSKSAYKG